MAKKSEGKAINSEADALRYLENLYYKWRPKCFFHSFSVSALKYIPKDYRTSNVLNFIIHRFRVFNLKEECNQEITFQDEESLIRMTLLYPWVLNSIDELSEPRKMSVDDKSMTLPVLVAFEVRKRLEDKMMRNVFIRDSNLSYPLAFNEYDKTQIYSAASNVEVTIGEQELYRGFDRTSDVEVIEDNLGKIVEAIRIECEKISPKEKEKSMEEQEEVDCTYIPKYKGVKYAPTNTKKLAILIFGHQDSGKSALSECLESMINGATVFSSDDLMEDSVLGNPPSFLIMADDNVVIYSDIHKFKDDNKDLVDIKRCMENPVVFRVYIRPANDDSFIMNAKYVNHLTTQEWLDKYLGELHRYDRSVEKADYDLVVDNTYTGNCIKKAADMIIETIQEKYPDLTFINPSDERPGAEALVSTLGNERIKEGAKRAEVRFGGIIAQSKDMIPE